MSAAAAEALIVLLALGLAVPAGVVGWVVGHYTGTSHTQTVTVSAAQQTTATTSPAATATTSPAATATTTTTTASAGGDPAAGKGVFTSAGCAGCHTFKAAGSSGTVGGPNLDQVQPSHALVVDRVTHGKGAMPPFAGQLSEQQINDVAAFVAGSR